MISTRTRVEYGAVAVFAWLVRSTPLFIARFLANNLGWIGAHVLKLRREVALDNLHNAFTEISRAECRRIYYRCWRHFMRVGVEMARLPGMSREFARKWINLSQSTILFDVLKRGKGVIVVSGHFGNWEWMGGAMALEGCPVTYVVTTQSNKLVEAWMDRMRQSVGIEIVPRRNAIRGVLSALKRNRAVAILIDQDAGEAGAFVPFFGRLASTPRGPAIFHVKTKTPIIFCTAPLDDKGIYQVKFEEIRFQDLTGDRDRDIHHITSKITELLEGEVKEHPEQWFWLHRRWKSVPPTTES